MKWIDKGGYEHRHVLVSDDGEILATVRQCNATHDWIFMNRRFINLDAAQKAACHQAAYTTAMPQANTGRHTGE